jgi:hypothetical protein
MLIGTPSEIPISAARSEPAASITARTSSIRSSIEGAVATGSDSPEPRRSKASTRANDPSASSDRANGSYSQTSSMCVM